MESILENNSLLAIDWGSTLGYVVKNIRRNAAIKVDVIQMVGGVGNKSKDTDANALTLTLADALNGDSYLMQAPFMVKSKVLKQLLMDEPHMQEHFDRIRHADIALLGLGSSKPEFSAPVSFWAHFAGRHRAIERGRCDRRYLRAVHRQRRQSLPNGAFGQNDRRDV